MIQEISDPRLAHVQDGKRFCATTETGKITGLYFIIALDLIFCNKNPPDSDIEVTEILKIDKIE